MVGTLLTLLAFTALLVLALLHLYWMSGGYWPGTDAASLMQRVIGHTPTGRMPHPLGTLGVALGLLCGAAVLALRLGWIPPYLPSPLIHVAAWTLACVFLLRGAGGYLDHRLRPGILGTPYEHLNRWVYSPLAMAIGMATLGGLLLE